MKVADAIGLFLKQHVDHVFCISGGASLHLIHGLVNAGVNIVCPQNEQSAAFQADCYARIRGMGCALTTSGPGATNLITGIATSFYDSVPCLYLTGNQTLSRLKGDLPIRQLGFQETPIVGMVKEITKYAYMVTDPKRVIEEIDKAIQIAKSGRQGPVLIDIPDDLQRAQL
jgi:acetolactate synthase-1/2/3 large subunit